MGIATPLPPVTPHSNSLQFLSTSMSQDYHHQGIFNFSNGFERSQQEQHHIAQQIRRDKMRVQIFEPPPPPPPVGMEEEEEETAGLPAYETSGMLSEMFSFPSGGGGAATATELLESQILQSYRNQRGGGGAADWFSHRQGMVVGGDFGESKHQISSINGDSAAAMQLFQMNPRPSPPSPSHPPPSSTLHMLLPHPNSSSAAALHGGGFSQFTWLGNTANDNNNPTENIAGVVEGQGLSLSLSSSLQHLEAAKAEEMRIGEGNMLFFGQGGGGSTLSSTTSQCHHLKNLPTGGALHLQGGGVHVGMASSYGGAVNMLRSSKYVKAAQDLLEEFCSVGRDHFKKSKRNPSSNPSGAADATGGGGDDNHPLSAADRLEHQRRKVKLLSILDEVDRRYNHYCEQMQMVVNSFDMVMGFGAAAPYTSLAQKAMSRHFRCLKDAVAAQLKHSCELLGEKDAGISGVTKGETPRLKMLDQSLRQQRAFHQMGVMEQEAWRPQRGLPEQSVTVLRAWLFEHFLHPYPSDADKHLLARQTGLSRNQVSNWFINARVRLWKPMVEEMYQQEAKEDSGNDQSSGSAQTPTPPPATTAAPITPPPPQDNNDPSLRHRFNDDQANPHYRHSAVGGSAAAAARSFPAMHEAEACGEQTGNADIGSTVIRFGTNGGDVSLTLGLRHAGNLPEKGAYSVGEFGGC